MQRRDVLRLLATGTALQFAPRSLLVTLAHARTVLAAESTPRTLNSHQYATVKTIAEIVIPRTETPGAADVGAADFIDLMLTEWYDEPQRALFLAGVEDIDLRSKTLFGKSFVDCSPVQQADILTALGEKMLAEPHTPSPDEFDPGTETSFYAMLRRLTLTAYYTSEAGATQELHFEVIPGSYQGCSETSPTKGVSEQK